MGMDKFIGLLFPIESEDGKTFRYIALAASIMHLLLTD
jgi:hypothetical protein